MPPRAQLTIRTPFLHFSNVSLFIKYWVSFVSGVWMVMKSAFSKSSSSDTGSIPKFLADCSDNTGSNPIVVIPNPRHHLATSLPILPTPMTPRVLPANSLPVYSARSHLPALSEAVACGIFLAKASIWAIASSPVEIVLPPGVFTTRIPLLVAARTSILSTPVPARPMIFKFFPASMISLVTFVPDLTTSPSYSPIILRSSSFLIPGFSTSS
mmetsp:Transcript_1414/g.1939  ORF Transcript_1414/g.1939 Transcript_1414/m.1939 type:complete len:212 (-) Transcript_1414:82-717(-)